jgi:uncharacterized membrane protein
LSARLYHLITSISLIALIALCVAWELWLAPQRPGGTWLVLKVIPLLMTLPGIVRARIYTYRVMTLLVIAYFVEGVVRAWSDRGLSAQLATVEVALTLVIFVGAILWIRKK